MNRKERRKLMRNKKYRKLVNNEAQKAVDEIEAAILKRKQENKQLSLPRKVSLSRLADGSQQIGESMSYENSFIKLDEKREINYRKYCELMKRNRIKVKIRDV